MSDWDSELKIGSKYRGGAAPREKVARTQAEINAARRSGAVVSTDKKYTGGQNKGGNPEGQKLTKVDRENEVAPPKTVDKEVGKAMAAARQALKLTQKDLGVKVNEKPTVINEYESGKAVPSQQVLAKLERALQVKLRGKDIGQPLFAKKS